MPEVTHIECHVECATEWKACEQRVRNC